MGHTLSRHEEEYLEVLYRFFEKKQEPTTQELAKALGVSPASVSEMLAKLHKKGLVIHEPYRSISLTEEGKKEGEKVLRKHRLIERFLRLIGVQKEKAHEEACALEHEVSDEVAHALQHTFFSGKEQRDSSIKKLTELSEGEKGVVVGLGGGHRSTQRLCELGLSPGTTVIVKRSSHYRGPLEIVVRNTHLALGHGIAEKVFVKKEGEDAQPHPKG